MTWATVHRFIPAHEFGKHGDRTACGIDVLPGSWLKGAKLSAVHADGATIAMSAKGEPFDCERCRRVLEIRHGKQ